MADYSPLREAYGIAGPPKPDLLVYSTNQCREVQDWWGFFGRRHDAPVLGVCPPAHLGETTEDHTIFVRGQLVRLIGQIEEHFGLKLDEERLKEAVALSSRASTLWRRALETARTHPSPLTFFDGLIHMAPVIVLRGSPTAVEYYEQFLAEMGERVRNGVGAVPDERFRLYWEGMPVWPKVRELSEKFLQLRTVIAASLPFFVVSISVSLGMRLDVTLIAFLANERYRHQLQATRAFEPYDGGDPLRWMAKTSTEIFINRDENTKQAFLVEMFKQFDIDGAIFHNARTCPNNTNSRFGMAQRLRDQLDLPILVIDGDLSDGRFFSTAQTMTNIEAFIEQIEERKR